jgi:hypothetical protein
MLQRKQIYKALAPPTADQLYSAFNHITCDDSRLPAQHYMNTPQVARHTPALVGAGSNLAKTAAYVSIQSTRHRVLWHQQVSQYTHCLLRFRVCKPAIYALNPSAMGYEVGN